MGLFDCQNPRVACSFCIMWLGFLLTIVYIIPLTISYQKFESYTPAVRGCTVIDFNIVQIPCTCTSSTSCQSGFCFTCQPRVQMTTAEGYALVGYADYVGSYALQSDAYTACQNLAMASRSDPRDSTGGSDSVGSGSPCWYTPGQSTSNAMLITFSAPTQPTSLIPVVVFTAAFAIGAVLALWWHCREEGVDDPDEPEAALQRAWVLAQQRALERSNRALRWGDYIGGSTVPQPQPANAGVSNPSTGASTGVVRNSQAAGAIAAGTGATSSTGGSTSTTGMAGTTNQLSQRRVIMSTAPASSSEMFVYADNPLLNRAASGRL